MRGSCIWYMRLGVITMIRTIRDMQGVGVADGVRLSMEGFVRLCTAASAISF